MNNQLNMSFLSDELKEAKTHKKEFLEQINRIMPWGDFTELVEPYYYEEGRRGNQLFALRLMLRIYVLQNCYDLGDDPKFALCANSWSSS